MSDISKKETIIVGYNQMRGDKSVLIIGRQLPEKPFEMIVYWKDDKKISLKAKINAMDIQGDNILCGTLDGGTILINAKLIAYLRTYPLKDGT